MKMERNKKIISILETLEEKHDIFILFAVETGSRLWGVESKNSDYDVRFVYKRDTESYLRINPLATQINHIEENIDMVGFDMFKYFKLLMSSNPNAIEWLQSNIIYIDRSVVKEKCLEFITHKFNPIALYYHYKSMCKQNYMKYLKSGGLVTAKKYLYSMRGLTNAKWVAEKNSLPPILFEEAMKSGLLKKTVQEELTNLIAKKKGGFEREVMPNLWALESYIEDFLKKEDVVESRKILDYTDIQEMIWELCSFSGAVERRNE